MMKIKLLEDFLHPGSPLKGMQHEGFLGIVRFYFSGTERGAVIPALRFLAEGMILGTAVVHFVGLSAQQHHGGFRC